jgi:hypothetical protein
VELFFIVAITDRGGEAITKRIREQFDDFEHTQRAGLTLLTSYQSLEAIKRNTNEPMKDLVERAATQIQELMNEETSLRMVTNGQ